MSFLIDQQTLDDLNIFGKYSSESIFSIFDKTLTAGAKESLKQMFLQPLSDEHAINRRMNIIRSFNSPDISFPFQTIWLDNLELYLSDTDSRSAFTVPDNSITSRVSNLMAQDPVHKVIYSGIESAIFLFHALEAFLTIIRLKSEEIPYQKELEEIHSILNGELRVIFAFKPGSKLSYEHLAELDGMLRFGYLKEVREIIRHVYLLDVYLTVARVGAQRGFSYALASDPAIHVLRLDGIYHPLLKNPSANSLQSSPGNNVIFLTGANMAGKSTFMKALGVAVYLAHMGFPVPAAAMQFSVRDGLLTTINLSDSLGTGVSHFYAEVLRIKKMALELSRSKSLFIIVDELFRGTNVKDAYEGTLQITGAFARRTNCMFVVSTHIIEAGKVLMEQHSNINFLYLPTKMDLGKPKYTYKLESGITSDRHGMLIVDNEGILDMLCRPKEEGQMSPGVTDRPRFSVDQQTLTDLNLLGKFKQYSIFSIFNKAETKGGEKLLEKMFHDPMTDPKPINTRSTLLRFFQQRNLKFPSQNMDFEIAEDYLDTEGMSHRIISTLNLLQKKFLAEVLQDERFQQIVAGIKSTLKVLGEIYLFFENFENPGPYAFWVGIVKDLFNIAGLKKIIDGFSAREASLVKLAEYDSILRGEAREHVKTIFKIVYELDVLISVSRVAREKGFGYAEAFDRLSPAIVSVSNFYHPALTNATVNTLSMDAKKNVVFLTGANMAGKSTLMKAFGVNFYLAHMGFPVAAKEFNFSVKDGLFSSINISDNLDQGISHFYAEVLRVKKVAELVQKGNNMLVIFDELFKGTNVKDAYDATLAVVKAFSENRNSAFVVSTHITEVGDELIKQKDNVHFAFLPTKLKGNLPEYSYKLAEGITSDRHGMLIIDNEKLMEILDHTTYTKFQKSN